LQTDPFEVAPSSQITRRLESVAQIHLRKIDYQKPQWKGMVIRIVGEIFTESGKETRDWEGKNKA
jgi:hypothetical protein